VVPQPESVHFLGFRVRAHRETANGGDRRKKKSRGVSPHQTKSGVRLKGLWGVGSPSGGTENMLKKVFCRKQREHVGFLDLNEVFPNCNVGRLAWVKGTCCKGEREAVARPGDRL